MRLASGDTVVFMGDSITECTRQTVEPPLGGGFVQFVHGLLAARHPALELDFVNSGVAGDTILDLERRWDGDVLAHAPDWLFVMVGVNDVLYRHVGDQPGRAVSDADHVAAYERLLGRTRAALPDCRIVLLEPTPLEEQLDAASHEPMRALAAEVRALGARHGLDVIDVLERFLATVASSPHKGWMIDVPHPNLRGQFILTLAVLDYLEW